MIQPKFPAGVIEGFYGKPWTDSERLMVLQWLRDGHLNTYIYAPKDDLKHRVAWRNLYGRSETQRLVALVRACHRNRVSFCYAIAPGLDIQFASDADQRALRKKLAQVRAAGADSFALLFDDIPAQLARTDLRRFGTPAAAQASTANSLLDWLCQESPAAELFFCPTVYCGAMARPSVRDSTYLVELGARLAPPVRVFWTGSQVVSDPVTLESVRELAGVIRRRPVLWDNLYANDYDMRRLHIGPYAGRPTALKKELAGAFLNPNCQCAVNFVPVRSFAAWVGGASRGDHKTSWRAAIRAWHRAFAVRGRHRVRTSELELLCEFFHLPSTPGRQAQRLLDDMQRLLGTPPGHWGGAERRFHRTSRMVLSLFDGLMGLVNRDVLHAIYPHVWELKERVLLIQAWVRWRKLNPGSKAGFASPDFPPMILRGGFCAALESMFALDPHGRLVPKSRG